MKISYHNHSNWSDGTATLEEMILAARMQGIDELGISDHYTLTPGEPVCWSMDVEQLENYVVAVQQLIAATADPIVRLGLEADYFPETVATVTARLVDYPFDYIIGSIHFLDGFPVDTDPCDWEPLSQYERNAIWQQYFARIREMVTHDIFDIVGHLDLPKKFGFLPTIDISNDINDTLDAIADAKMAIEINTAGWHKNINEAYPSADILAAACRRDIPFVINADAHSAGDLSRDFDRAYALAAHAGYTRVARYQNRERSLLTFP